VIYEASTIAVVVFLMFVAVTLALSFYLGSRAKSSQGYFAAHGQIHWFVNGMAFAGDYLSAASFLGICGMIAFYGYDGFLYSIGYLAGWIVALFVVAEPMKRLGKFTFADALDAKFNSRGIKLAAGISTLAVSVFYLIPQMVGAGVLIQPLLGFPHWAGVLLVGATVIFIVVTAGMVSTTWVQFLKGSLLVIFSAVLTLMILNRGFETAEGGADGHVFRTLGPFDAGLELEQWPLPSDLQPATLSVLESAPSGQRFVHVQSEGEAAATVWHVVARASGDVILRETQTVWAAADGTLLVNGQPKGTEKGEAELHPVGHLSRLPDGKTKTGPLGPLTFFSTLQESEVVLWAKDTIQTPNGDATTVYYQKPTAGSQVLRPGEHPRFRGIRSERFVDKLNFLSLMAALFCGTASLPHILIRYYTVKDEVSARKSTIVGIASIGFFYVLTLYLGLGAMTSGALDVTNSNMAAPLLAKSMNEWLFAIISAIAFTTVLGTVSGLILASAGAVSHDLITSAGIKLTDHEKVRVAKFASVAVGAVAIVLGILFKELNVSYLVGWAFSIAASANLPSLVMLLFWKGVTKQGITAAVIVGMVSSLGWILLSADTFTGVYGLSADAAVVPFSQPGIVTIPLGFATLVVVSWMTRRRNNSGT
jgi:cation/acetate symporter